MFSCSHDKHRERTFDIYYVKKIKSQRKQLYKSIRSIMIFDTHAHYLDHRFDEDREELITSLSAEGINHVVEVSADKDDFDPIIELINKYEFFYGSLGVHPSEVEVLTEADMDRIRELSIHDRIVAIGEIGLDYHFDDDPSPEIQKKWFERQVELAKELNLPIIVHSRDAAKDTYDLMKACDAGSVGGVIHCFSYSVEMAREFLDMGFFIGLDGPVTFKNGKKAKEVAAYVPDDRLVVETDCPYMAPDPVRGTRNSSINLKYIIAEIARIKDKSIEETEQMLYNNARNLYRLV